jgi:hypothetical protein
MSEDAPSRRSEGLIAIVIAILASFVAVTSIKGSNVAQAMEQANAERNNSWAWYQAVRVREDMATYQLANLQRLIPAQSDPPAAARLAAEIAEQEAEVVRIRARKDEVQHRAEAAEVEHAALSQFDDQYDLSGALISIALALFAVCLLIRTRWLFVFAVAPALAGVGMGATAMLRIPVAAEQVFAWLS